MAMLSALGRIDFVFGNKIHVLSVSLRSHDVRETAGRSPALRRPCSPSSKISFERHARR